MFHKINLPHRQCCCYSMIEKYGFYPELELYLGDSMETVDKHINKKFDNSDAKVTFKVYFWKTM